MVDLVGGFVVTLVKQVINNCREVCILWPNRFLIPEILSMIDSDYFKNKQPLHKKYYPSSGWIICPPDQIVSCWSRIHRWYQKCISSDVWDVEDLISFKYTTLAKQSKTRPVLASCSLYRCLSPKWSYLRLEWNASDL